MRSCWTSERSFWPAAVSRISLSWLPICSTVRVRSASWPATVSMSSPAPISRGFYGVSGNEFHYRVLRLHRSETIRSRMATSRTCNSLLRARWARVPAAIRRAFSRASSFLRLTGDSLKPPIPPRARRTRRAATRPRPAQTAPRSEGRRSAPVRRRLRPPCVCREPEPTPIRRPRVPCGSPHTASSTWCYRAVAPLKPSLAPNPRSGNSGRPWGGLRPTTEAPRPSGGCLDQAVRRSSVWAISTSAPSTLTSPTFARMSWTGVLSSASRSAMGRSAGDAASAERRLRRATLNLHPIPVCSAERAAAAASSATRVAMRSSFRSVAASFRASRSARYAKNAKRVPPTSKSVWKRSTVSQSGTGVESSTHLT